MVTTRAHPVVQLATRPVWAATRRPEARPTRPAVANLKVAVLLAPVVAANLAAAALLAQAAEANLVAAATRRLEARLARVVEARPAVVGRLAPAPAVSPDRVGLMQGLPVSLELAGAAEERQVQPGLLPPESEAAVAGRPLWEEPEAAPTWPSPSSG